MNKQSLFIAAIVLAFAGGAPAATITVTNNSDGPAPGPAGSLRKAVNDAASGDTITFFLPANSTVTLSSGELFINKSLTINGPGANRLSVQRSFASPNFRIFNISGNVNVTISGLTIANGSATGDGGGGIANSGGTVSISNSTISGNSAPFSTGGGILNSTGTLTITNSTISGNSAINSAIRSGTGGGISNGSMLTIINSTISGNSAGSYGGGIMAIGGTVSITNSTISGNSGGNGGGGIFGGGGPINARNTIIALNTATSGRDVAGALASQGYNLIGNTSSTTINGTTAGNQLNVDPMLSPLRDNGGPTCTHALLSGSPAIEAGDSSGSNTDQRGLARPVDSPVIANVGDGSDIGACEVQADLLPGCNTINRIVSNNNDSGAGSLRAVLANVCAGSTITFASNVRGAINLTSGELLINKSLTIAGPGAKLLTVQRGASAGNFRIFNIAPGNFNAAISGLTIANGNASGNFGGGIYNNGGTLTVSHSTLSGNSTYSPGGGGGGGGIFNNGTVTITHSTLSGNSAPSGGGIYNSSGTVTVTNSTLSGNSTTGNDSWGGGGIYNIGGTVTITNSTLSGNTAGEPLFGIARGGGIFNDSGTLRARNTIIALNTSASGPDVNGPLTSEGFNLIGLNDGALISPAQFSDQIGTAGSPIDPLLGLLQDNGGPTLTSALQSGSPAIDKGHSSGSFTDQRGFTRPVDQPGSNVSGGDGGDIGAFEFGGAAASLKILSITRSGNGPVVLQVAGFPYGVHRIQASVDLSSGSFIDTATVTADAAGRFQYQDTVAGSTNFYRVAFP